MAWNNDRRRRTYQCWQDMKQRCYNPKNHNYKRYGGRGIVVCQRWLASFDNFVDDMGEKPNGLTLDRTDNDGMYAPENCHWATLIEQRHNCSSTNMQTLNGVTKPLRLWAIDFGINEVTLARRVKKLGSLEAAIAKPVNPAYRRSARKGNQARWGTAIAAGEGDS